MDTMRYKSKLVELVSFKIQNYTIENFKNHRRIIYN